MTGVISPPPSSSAQDTVASTVTTTPIDTADDVLPPLSGSAQDAAASAVTSISDTTDDILLADTKKPPAGKVRCIRLFPTKDERRKLQEWMGTVRWTYNQCLVAVEKGVKRSQKELREKHIKNTVFENDPALKWVLNTPWDMRDEAARDLLKAYQSNFAIKNRRFKMKLRSAKDRQQSIVINSKHWGATRGDYAFLRGMKAAEPLPAQLEYDSRIVMNRLGEFYLCIPKPLDVRAESQGPIFTESQEKR